MRNQSVFNRVLCLLIAAAYFTTTGQVQAQFGEAAGIAEAMLPDYYKRDIVLFEQGLNLDDTQRTIIESLYDDYDQTFQDGLAKMRKRMDDMRGELQAQDVDRVLRIVFKPIEDWTTEKRAIGEEFLQNVKVVLTPEQQDMWPKFERFLFREKKLPNGNLSGETLNLFNIVRDMQLTPPEAEHVQPTLDAYDEALDAALRNRQKALYSDRGDMFRSLAEQNSALSVSILKKQIDASVGVRTVNDQFLDRLTEVMPGHVQSRFRQEALERAYPRIYRPTPVQNIFKEAKQLEGLDAATLQAVTSLEAQYLAELATANEGLLAVVRNWEPEEQRRRAEAFAQRMSGQSPQQIEDPTREMFVARDNISRDYARRLQALLTPEQFAQLPGAFRWAEQPGEARPNDAMPNGERQAPTPPIEPTGGEPSTKRGS